MLEISWLRDQVANRADRSERDDEIFLRLERAMQFGIGRRDLFKLAVTSSALAPLATFATQRSALVAESSGRSVSICSASGRRWTIDPDRFDGKPSVTLAQHEKAFVISLTNAIIPGTGLRCDFRLTGRQQHGSCSGDFEFCCWGGRSTVSLDEWVEGSSTALAQIRLPSSEAGCAGFSVRVEGDATLIFSSDWSFIFHGDRIAQLVVNDNAAECSSLTVDIPPVDARSLLKDPSQRRSRAVFSGPGMPSLRPDVGRASVTCSADLQLQAEFVRAHDDQILVASLWSADAVDAGLMIRVGGDSAETIGLPIDSYRLVQLHDGERSNSALFAGVTSGEHWSDVSDASVAIVARPGAMISATSCVNGSETCTCEPKEAGLVRFVIPFVGADSACFTKRPPHGQGNTDSVEFKDHFSFFRSEPIDLDDYSLKVSRTADSFVAVFRFRNIQLQSVRGHWFLARKTSCVGESIVEFELPSQHLNEEAVFSASPPGLSMASKEVLCGPFNSEQAKFVTFVGMYAFDSWKMPNKKPLYADIRALLGKFIVELINKEPDPGSNFLKSIDRNGYELPTGFARYLTQEYAKPLLETAKGPGPKPEPIYDRILAAANKEAELDRGFAGWKPRAIDACSTHLLFKAVFAKDAEVPCHLNSLMGWSNPNFASGQDGLRFEELLSPRAIAADTPLQEQKKLSELVGAPIHGLQEATREPKRGKDACIGGTCNDVATALEMPYRLVVTPIRHNTSADLAPGAQTFWQSVAIPRSIWGSAVPLWHVFGGRSGGPPIAMRALYSPDYRKEGFFDPPPPNDALKMRTSLDAHDRHNLVALSSGFGQPAQLGTESVVKDSEGEGIYVPQPFHARQLVLTPLGATFDFLGTWDPPAGRGGALTVSKWIHRARIRRDTEVTVEYRGYLLPLGIPAVFIKKTTREFKRDGKGNKESYRAVLVQRYFIRVDQKTKEFPALYQSFDSRDWCFRRIKVLPEETPPLLPPEEVAESEICSLGRQAFWPMIPLNPQTRSCSTGKLFEFTVENGERAFNVPLVFVDNQIVHTPTRLKTVLEDYAKEVAKRKWDMASKPGEEFGVLKALARMVKGDVEYLPGVGSRNSRHATRWFVLGFQLSGQASVPAGDEPRADDEELLRFDAERERCRQPPFYPRMSQALIESKLLAQLSGTAVARNNISYHPTFVEDAFHETKNVGGVFARFVQQGAPMVFGKNTTASGGAMCPTVTMVAIAREHGPIGGDTKSVYTLSQPKAGMTLVAKSASGSDDPVAKFMKGVSDPVEYFAGALGDAKLLGCVRLVDIIKAVLQVTGARVPRINQKEIFDGAIDLLKPVLLNIADGPVDAMAKLASKLADSSKTSPAVSTRLLPPLRAAIASLDQVRAEFQKASPQPDVVGGLVGSAYSNLRQFVGDARQLSENPVALLPPSVANKIEEVRKVYDQLVAIRQAVERFPTVLRSLLIEALDAETQALQRAVEATPEFRAMIEWVARIKAQLDALAQSIADCAWQRIGQALQTMAVPVAELRNWLEINRESLENAVIAFAKPVRVAMMEAAKKAIVALDRLRAFQITSGKVYDAATKANKPEAAAKILEVMRSTHQVREILVAFIDFANHVDKASDNALLDGLSTVLNYFQKSETLLRKTGEIIALTKEGATLCGGFGNLAQVKEGTESLETLVKEMQDTGNNFVGAFHGVVVKLKLSTLLAEFRARMGTALSVGSLKDSIETVLKEAVSVAETLERTPAELSALLENTKGAFFEQIESYLSLLLSRVAPKAAEIVTAAERWSNRFIEVQTRLRDTLNDSVLVPCKDLTVWTPNLKDAPLAPALLKRLKDLDGRVSGLSKACDGAITAPERVLDVIGQVCAVADEVFALVTYVGETVHGGNLDALLEQRLVVEKVLEVIGVPTKLRITYDWDTNIEDFPRGGGAIFRPVLDNGTGAGKHPRLAIHSVTEMDLRNPTFPSTTVNGSIDAFDLHLFGSTPFLIVKLHPVTFVSGSHQPMKFDVRVKDVKFGEALNFVNDLAKYIGADSGFYLHAADGFPGIEIGYRFNKDIIQLAALTLQNVSLSLAVILPFDNTPMRLKAAIGSRQRPVLASVGIYGAGFFVAMTLRADAMELLEFSLEYGGVTGLSFGGGIATGTCKVTAGVYIALGARDEISGFFSAVGALSIASLIKIGAALVVSISKAQSQMTGSAIFTFSFSIAIVDYSYSVGVSYTKDGDKNMSMDAEGKDSTEGNGSAEFDEKLTASSSQMRMRVDDQGAVYNVLEDGATHPADYRVDMHEKRAAPDAPPTLHAGLAESSIWQAYWNGFSDLSDAPVEMCTILGS